MNFLHAKLALFPHWYIETLIFIIGAMFGSFLNVCIYRIPAGKSVVFPSSHCACGKPIRWYNNIPILSWFILRGKAACCGRAYSFRYPAIEFLTAVIFLICWRVYGIPEAEKAFVMMAFLAVLICATFIDIDHMIIPDVFTVWTACAGVAISAVIPAIHNQHQAIHFFAVVHSVVISLQGVFIGSGLVLWVALIGEAFLKKDVMGFGDVKFLGAIGAFCGWKACVFSLFGGAVVGTIFFAYAIGRQLVFPRISDDDEMTLAAVSAGADTTGMGRIGFGVEVPFGPMLAIAAAAYILGIYRIFDPMISLMW